MSEEADAYWAKIKASGMCYDCGTKPIWRHAQFVDYCKSCYSKNGYRTHEEIDLDELGDLRAALDEARAVIEGLRDAGRDAVRHLNKLSGETVAGSRYFLAKQLDAADEFLRRHPPSGPTTTGESD